jgi:hypothetical protein
LLVFTVIPWSKLLINTFCSSLGSTLLFIESTTIHPLYLWVIRDPQPPFRIPSTGGDAAPPHPTVDDALVQELAISPASRTAGTASDQHQRAPILNPTAALSPTSFDSPTGEHEAGGAISNSFIARGHALHRGSRDACWAATCSPPLHSSGPVAEA